MSFTVTITSGTYLTSWMICPCFKMANPQCGASSVVALYFWPRDSERQTIATKDRRVTRRIQAHYHVPSTLPRLLQIEPSGIAEQVPCSRTYSGGLTHPTLKFIDVFFIFYFFYYVTPCFRLRPQTFFSRTQKAGFPALHSYRTLRFCHRHFRELPLLLENGNEDEETQTCNDNATEGKGDKRQRGTWWRRNTLSHKTCLPLWNSSIQVL
ncbi:hypothetical protein B0H19DRAFT_1095339 [Mycena capillaripes]|nr:hypothetical protein B0H19DRAFT_1095339 [Mycena capillaripes]